ncbi:MAG TPA: hypothetical protein VFS47_01460 [Steroidobacteraceae bacterium]|nr:hypothetical protein [Steroidobacteraceae bacterium]
MVRYTAKPDRAAENEALARAVFTEVHEKMPADVAYALFRNGNEFIHVFVNLKEDESASVTELPTFVKFQKDIADRCEILPQVTRTAADLVDSYGFLAARM